MTCHKHPWALPTQRGCLMCGWQPEIDAIRARQGEVNDQWDDPNAQRKRRQIVGARLAQASFEQGRARGQRAMRERARARRSKAAQLLREGMCGVEVDDVLGMARGWCSEQASKHPELGRAMRGIEAAE